MSTSAIEAARQNYVDAVLETRKLLKAFTFWAHRTHTTRKTYLLKPNRENRAAFKHAKKMRALRLRSFRSSRDHREACKKHYLRLKAEQNLPLNEKALAEARKLIGIMEHGGNNMGEQVMRIIKANGGFGPEPWCGDFVAYCYRLAGSKAVDRRWASVSLLGTVAGVRRVSSSNVKPGYIVRYVFDHTGLVEDPPVDLTIEGNTGASGAVSDSSTGGDGVYRKSNRTLAQVNDFLEVTK